MKRYVLITAAYNEEDYIGKTIQSVLAQNLLPKHWIIVSDGSADRTDEIIKRYSSKHEFIQYIRIEKKKQSHNFASKVCALNTGYNIIKKYDFDFIGHLDADITFYDSHYYELILDKFLNHNKLGIAGGYIYENNQGQFKSRPFNSVDSVAGGIQVFRRECYEDIAGFLPLEFGGEDWYAEVVARMKGWKVKAFPELHVLHHKPTLQIKGRLSEGFRQGSMDYSLGSDPVFEIFKCLYRLKKKSHILFAFFRLCGFFRSCILKVERPVSVDFIRYLRKEQRKRLRIGFLSFFTSTQ